MVPSKASTKAKSSKQPKQQKKSKKNNSSRSSQLSLAPVAMAKVQRYPSREVLKSHRFKNSELVGTISGDTAFKVVRFEVNPGLTSTFPYLATQAKLWEQYRFHKLCFRYVTRTGTSTVGSVILSPDYNVRDPPPATESEATNTQDAVEDAVWKDVECHLDPKAMFSTGDRKFVRGGVIGADLNVYDACNFYVATIGETSTAQIGKLWVDYDVELFVPQSNLSGFLLPAIVSYYQQQADSAGIAPTVNTPIPWDLTLYDPLGWGTPVAGIFTPPAGDYQITASVVIENGATEAWQWDLSIFRNGAILPGQRTGWKGSTNAGNRLALVVHAVTGMTGTDTLSVRSYVTTGGTTAFVKGLYTSLLIRPG